MIAYLFDVDGVLTDLVEKQVTEEELFSHMISFLQNGDIVAFNTGRTSSWVKEKIIDPLLEKLESKELLSDVVIVSEKGGTWMTFDKETRVTEGKDSSMIILQEFREQIKQLVEERYKDAMFFDSPKQTMISVEMHDGFDMARYQSRQKEFDKEVAELLAQKGLHEKYKIHSLSISTDIEEHHAGKALGVARLLKIFAEKGITPSQFITFGDNLADLEMADELFKKGKKVTFVYTGDKEKLEDVTRSYPVVFVAGYSRGTLEYLKSLES